MDAQALRLTEAPPVLEVCAAPTGGAISVLRASEVGQGPGVAEQQQSVRDTGCDDGHERSSETFVSARDQAGRWYVDRRRTLMRYLRWL